DPAIADFLPKLRNHLLVRLHNPDEADPGVLYSPSDLNEIIIVGDRIYSHATMRVNYTTYDMQRSYDSLSVKQHANVMTLSLDHDANTGITPSGHPFMYRRILGIYHVEVRYNKPGQPPTSHQMEFLWVRNYHRDTTFKAGLQHRRFHRISFVPDSDSDAFTFLDLDEVIRAVHLIPAFSHRRTSDWCQGPTIARTGGDDWKYFYVNLYILYSLGSLMQLTWTRKW
ncbi:hypothetical protein K474DRAFT_1607701, partial [Panus rudis PR-1116 ss-1]